MVTLGFCLGRVLAGCLGKSGSRVLCSCVMHGGCRVEAVVMLQKQHLQPRRAQCAGMRVAAATVVQLVELGQHRLHLQHTWQLGSSAFAWGLMTGGRCD